MVFYTADVIAFYLGGGGVFSGHGVYCENAQNIKVRIVYDRFSRFDTMPERDIHNESRSLPVVYRWTELI